MAQPDDVGLEDYKPAVVLASGTEDSVILNPRKRYHLYHDGEDATGNADTGTIYLKCDAATVDADESEGANKAKLMDGRDLTIGPGISILYFKMAANDCTFTIIPEELFEVR